MPKTNETPTIFQCRAGHQLATQGGYCTECATCAICKKPLTSVEYTMRLRESERNSEDPIFEHPYCYSEIEMLAAVTETIEIPKSLYEKMNMARLMITVSEDLNTRTNEFDADIRARNYYRTIGFHEMSYAEQAMNLRRMESICATLSLMMSKSRRHIEKDLSDRDQALYEKARSERSTNSIRAPHTAKIKENQTISKHDKQINNLMKMFSCDKATAESMLKPKETVK